MRFENVAIQSLAYVDAPHRISSDDIEAELAPAMERFRMPPGMLENLTGIRARRFWDEGVQPSDVATIAAERAIDDAGIDPQRIGILINTSVCKDYIEPSVASLVHGNLGLGHNCLNFDLSNACLGFVNGMHMIGNMIEMGQVDYGLVVDGEGSRFVVDSTIQRLIDPNCDIRTFRHQVATLTLGSGAAAMVLARADLATTSHRLRGCLSLAATEHNRLCTGQNNYMSTDSKGLMAAGIELSVQMRQRMIQEMQDPANYDEIVIHQVSEPHTNKLIDATCLDDEKVYRIYPEFGNIGPAGIPMVLGKSLDAGRIEEGDEMILLGIGSGLNTTVMEVVW